MTGGMKIRRFLCLRAFQPIDGRDGRLSVNNPSLFVNKVRLLLLYRSLISVNSSFIGNYLFPVWECQTPRLGTKHSQARNNRSCPTSVCSVISKKTPKACRERNGIFSLYAFTQTVMCLYPNHRVPIPVLNCIPMHKTSM